MTFTDIPTAVEHLTPALLTELLADSGHHTVVRAVEATPVGTGQMAESLRLRMTFDGPIEPPSTMIAKLATGDPGRREFASGAFGNEVTFYRELATEFAIPVPACYAAALSESCSEFVVLLEDLGAARQGDQIAGCTAGQARAVALAAAGLHAPRWNDPALLQRFPLPTSDDRELMDSVLAPMIEQFRDRFHPGAAANELLDWLVEHAGAWLVAPTSHTVLIHGDLRIDNVLFGPDGAVTVVDWQTITTGSALRDIAFLLVTSLDVADRRAHERDIVAAYHRRLVELGVRDYTAEPCWADYLGNLIQAPLVVVFGAGAARPTARGDAMFAAMAHRAAVALADLAPEMPR